MTATVALVFASGVLALLFAAWRARVVARADVGTERMAEISGYIQEGAMAFLAAEGKTGDQQEAIRFRLNALPVRCPASPQRTLLAENLGKPSL